jgi:hypothetical protein
MSLSQLGNQLVDADSRADCERIYLSVELVEKKTAAVEITTLGQAKESCPSVSVLVSSYLPSAVALIYAFSLSLDSIHLLPSGCALKFKYSLFSPAESLPAGLLFATL